MNIRLEYLYRDSGNFKNWGEVIFINKNNYDPLYLEKEAEKLLMDGMFFIADKAKVPNLRFHDYKESLDHNWHEFRSFQSCPSETTDLYSRDITEFIESFKSASKL